MKKKNDKSNGLTRREIIRLGLGTAGVVLVNQWGVPVWADSEPSTPTPVSKTGKAKSVIQIWLWGGPCHLDTFDPKPDAGNDYCGPFNKPLQTNVNGIQINELMPILAQQADKYSLIRSMTHGNNSHETAAYMMQTGRKAGDRLVYPGIGAVASLFKGYDHGYTGLIPPYIVITQAQGRFSESGFLGPRYKPFATGGDPSQKRFAVSGIVAEGISDQRQLSRRELLHSLDTLGKSMNGQPSFELMDKSEEKAYSLITGNNGKVFDLSQEKDDLRDKYGRTKFGQSCLAARRLVEQGIPYITINYGGWDTHKRHFETMRRMLPELDKGLGTLLQDLSQRGLLDSTIVWCCGEFGRTPKVQWEAPWNGGRGHFGNCFSVLVAGGGFKGGQVVGSSDEKGQEVKTRPVYPQDLIGSLYQLMGIDPQGALPNSRGLNISVLPLAESGNKSGGVLKEIM